MVGVVENVGSGRKRRKRKSHAKYEGKLKRRVNVLGKRKKKKASING